MILSLATLEVRAQAQNQVEVRCTAHKAIKMVMPDYPEPLKKQGIEGQLFLLIDIDRKGNVDLAEVWIGLHPELDRLAVEALKKWKFEPFIYAGEPIRATFFVRVIFNSGNLNTIKEGPSQPAPPDSISPELRAILDKCDEYCQKLTVASLYYVCTEKMSEISRPVVEKTGGLIRGLGHDSKTGKEIMEASFNYAALGNRRKSECLYDYQLIRKEGKVEERRVLLEKDGKKVTGQNPPQPATRLYSLKPIYVPAWLLSGEQQTVFSYMFAKEEKVSGKEAYVIEVKPRTPGGGGLKDGRIWFDKSTYRVLKAEVRTTLMPGYEPFFQECSINHWKPLSTGIHYYEIEKNGILYPSRSVIRIEYDKMFSPKRDVKYAANIRYGRYRFFTVETEAGIREPRQLKAVPRIDAPESVEIHSPATKRSGENAVPGKAFWRRVSAVTSLIPSSWARAMNSAS
jgi:protein TonB